MGAPGSNPVQGLLLLFLFICYHKSWDRVVKMEDNTSFKAKWQWRIILHLRKRSCWLERLLALWILSAEPPEREKNGVRKSLALCRLRRQNTCSIPQTSEPTRRLDGGEQSGFGVSAAIWTATGSGVVFFRGEGFLRKRGWRVSPEHLSKPLLWESRLKAGQC